MSTRTVRMYFATWWSLYTKNKHFNLVCFCEVHFHCNSILSPIDQKSAICFDNNLKLACNHWERRGYSLPGFSGQKVRCYVLHSMTFWIGWSTTFQPLWSQEMHKYQQFEFTHQPIGCSPNNCRGNQRPLTSKTPR